MLTIVKKVYTKKQSQSEKKLFINIGENIAHGF